MIRKTLFTLTIVLLAATCSASGEATPPPSSVTSAAERQPFYVTLAFHFDVPFPWESGPTPETATIQQIVDELTARGLRAHLGFQATVTEQLAQAFPDTVAQIRAAQMPIAYHVGPGHNLEVLYLLRGPQRECSGPVDCFAAQWEYETPALYPLTHPQASQPITPARTGGWLALEEIFGVIPLPTDSHGDNVMYRLLGSHSYELSPSPVGELVTPSMDYGKDVPEGVIRLPEMGEHLLYPASIIDGGKMWEGGLPCQSAARYFGKEPGEDAPALIDPYAWLDILLRTQPRDRINHLGLLTHTWPWRQPGGKEWYLALVDYMLDHPDDFVIIAEDPAGNQYLPQNGPLPFFQDRYGAGSFEEMLALDPPVEGGLDDWLYERAHPSDPLLDQEFRDETAVVEDPTWVQHRTRALTLSRAQVVEAAGELLAHWPLGDHSGNLGSPPRLLSLKDGQFLALAEAVQAFLLALDGWQASGSLPDQVTLIPIYGPVDTPVYRLEEIPHLPEDGNYGMAMQKYQIAPEHAPDPELVKRQGLPGAGTVDYGWPAVVRLEADDLMAAVIQVREAMTDRVPGVITVTLPAYDGGTVETPINAAEFLYAMAQEVRWLDGEGVPGSAALVSMKVTADQVGSYVEIEGADTGFAWRGFLTHAELNRAWVWNAGCMQDANGNGVGDVVDIMTTASDLSCHIYLPVVAANWRQPWPTPTADSGPPTATPTLTATVAPTATPSQADMVVDTTAVQGTINSLNGIQSGPRPLVRGDTDLTSHFQAAGVDHVRLPQDTLPNNLTLGGIFPDPHADPDDPSAYDFSRIDLFMQAIVDAGIEPLWEAMYDIGQSDGLTEGGNRSLQHGYYPRNPAKWAAVIQHTLKHFNDGWANGHHWNVTYVEFINEPFGLGGCRPDEAGVEACWDLFQTFVAAVHAYEAETDRDIQIVGPAEVLEPQMVDRVRSRLLDRIQVGTRQLHRSKPGHLAGHRPAERLLRHDRLGHHDRLLPGPGTQR